METRGGPPATDPSGAPPPKASLTAKRGSVPVITVSPAPEEILFCCNRDQQQQRRGSVGEPAEERGGIQLLGVNFKRGCVSDGRKTSVFQAAGISISLPGGLRGVVSALS